MERELEEELAARRIDVVITDMAIESKEIDEAAVEAAVKRAEETMARKDDVSAEESATMQAILAKSLAQLKVKRRRNH